MYRDIISVFFVGFLFVLGAIGILLSFWGERMDKTLEELAADIIYEIEKEDFIYAIKHYGCYRVEKTAQEIKEWLKWKLF